MTGLQPFPGLKPCEILKSANVGLMCYQWIKRNGLAADACQFKSWDLMHCLPYLAHGNLLDMGCGNLTDTQQSASVVLLNAQKLGVLGEKVGIDLVDLPPVPGMNVIKGSLLEVPYPDAHFQTVACLSVIEHGVDVVKFCREVSRLLKPGGDLWLTFDYWPDAESTPDWSIFNRQRAGNLIEVAQGQFGLKLQEEMDWTIGEVVITPKNYSPGPVSYTFGAMWFRKLG